MSSSKLPEDFLWGFATASYQIEGGAHEGGRGDSIWDTFCQVPGKIADESNGDVACDSYHRWKEDIELLKSLEVNTYRFSISWSRVIPLGGRNDPINQEGLRFYQDVLDELVKSGITPLVTLFHWDLPQALYDRYGGFLNQEEYVQDFVHFAEVVFEALGSKVRNWITYNEPWCSSILGYSIGQFAPGHTSDRSKSKVGDSSTEPWKVGHTILVAHGAAVKLYRQKFKAKQQGRIGITLNGDWTEPWDANDQADIEAAERKLEFSIGWFADPIYQGDYPLSMRNQLGDRLPKFSDKERELVRGSNDFYGMNHYTADYIKHLPGAAKADDFSGNVEILKTNKDGFSIGPETQSAWLRPHAAGFRKLLGWISARYGRPVIYVTENGTSVKDESQLTPDKAVHDEFRCQYFRDYINALVQARGEDGVDVRGYMAWSLLDNFEWAEGYETRFGVVHVDFAKNQERRGKDSARVVADIFKRLCRV